MMHRRAFGFGLAASVLACGPAAANTDRKEDRDHDLRSVAPVAFTIRGRQVLIESLIVLASASNALGIDLRREFPVFNENRADLGNLPVIGGLTRKSLKSRLRGASFAADAVLTGTALVLMRLERDLKLQTQITIAHRDLSWDVPATLGKVRMGGLPPLAALEKLPVVGAAYQTRNSGMLILVRPTRVREPQS